MNTQHTPGPWRMTEHASGLLKIETKDRVICDGFSKEFANARLIAAAPELLQMLDKLTSHVLHYASMPGAHSDAHKDAANARAAIAKATTP